MPLLQSIFEGILDEIEASDLFNASFYAQLTGVKGDRRELIREYLTNGEGRLLSPSEDFDVVFYRHTNPDVVQSGMSPLLHFLRYGRNEGRYPNRRVLATDAQRVEASGLFDHRLFARHPRAQTPGLSDIESYLTSRDEAIRATRSFDPAFYVAHYDDAPAHHGAALLHYIVVGLPRSRISNEGELIERMRVVERDFVPAHYLAQFDVDEAPHRPLRHFVLHEAELRLEPSPDFSVDYYARAYPDLRGKTPYFQHFVQAGRREGRTGRPNLANHVVRGERIFRPDRSTIFVANHEITRTGAPLVGLTLAERLCERHNVIAGLGLKGDLEQDFLKQCFLAVKGLPAELEAEFILRDLKATYGLDAIVLNSVETVPYGLAALNAAVPSVALLHEFAEYTAPPGKMAQAVETVDRVIVPAQIVGASLQRDMVLHRKHEANNVAVRAQGCLPNLPVDLSDFDLSREQVLQAIGLVQRDDAKIVLGAGHVQMRKGVDLFVQTAAEVRALAGENVRFVWVGAGWNEADLHYGLWVADMIRRLDLQRHVFFLNVQSRLNTVFALSDVFFLPSRLDPFPNVALDAFKAGKPVVCFDRATGIAEHLGDDRAVGRAASFCDVSAAARAIVEMMDDAAQVAAASNRRFAEQRFDFDSYVQFVAGEVERATAGRTELEEGVRRIELSGTFDAGFHEGMDSIPAAPECRRAMREYVARGSKGLFCYSPRPGFNDGLYRSAHPEQAALRRAPLDLAMSAGDGQVPTTHCCVTIDPLRSASRFRGRVALHIHLYYSDLAEEFVERLTLAECHADLFITTTSREKRLEILYAFRKFKGGSVRVFVVSNRGRDIGPMLTSMKRYMRSGYDVVGHFHGKRSATVGGPVGDRWRTFLLDTLLGTRENLGQVLSLFEDRGLGLVFAEDRRCVGWTDNLAAAQRLAGELSPPPRLAPFPLFPLGTMFWARPTALEPLWRRNFQPTEFPPEPLSYDGTVLHAIERLLPAVTESTNLRWCTVHRPGISW